MVFYALSVFKTTASKLPQDMTVATDIFHYFPCLERQSVVRFRAIAVRRNKEHSYNSHKFLECMILICSTDHGFISNVKCFHFSVCSL